MKKSKAIALMLIGMIAFMHVEAKWNHPPTTSEPALQKCTAPESVCPGVATMIEDKSLVVLAQIKIFISPELEENNQTTTRVKECKPCPCDVISHIDAPLKIGWC